MAVGQSQLERAIYDIKRGSNVSQLEDVYKISTRERIIKEVKVPVIPMIPTDDVFFSKTDVGKPDVEFLKDHFFREGRITEEHALYIIDKATQLLRAEPNVLTVDGPVTVCGDICGQYYDLMKLFEVGGRPSITRYLFLGDYINGGYFSIECLLYLWTLKIWYPNSFFLLRGHHECRYLTTSYQFEIECKHKYSERMYEACLESFCALPLVAIMDNRYFCVHGGISPELHTIDDIRKLNRFCEPTAGLMCDLLCSGPIERFDKERITEESLQVVDRNSDYYLYTYKAVCDFLERNRLVSVIRAHQMQMAGYRIHRKRQGHPSVISVFSAPNSYAYRNMAAVLKCDGKLHTVCQFHQRLHPFRPPEVTDAFSWSLPFICEKILDMLAAMLYMDFLELNKSIDILTQSLVPVDRDMAQRLEMLQNKIFAVRCISYMFSVLREESEHVSELKLLSPLSEFGVVLSLRAEAAKNVIRCLNKTRILDADNERLFPIMGRLTVERDLQIREADVQDVEKVLREKERDLRIREAGVQDGEKVLRVKERDLQIRGAEVEDVEKVLRIKERVLQIREAEVQKMLQAVNEGREARGIQEDNLRQRSAAMKEWEENLRLREAALMQQMTIAREPNDAARESDVFSLSSNSTIRNSPHVRSNVDLPPGGSARLKQDSRDDDNESASLASTTRGGSKHTNTGFSSRKSHARLKEDSGYYGNE